MYKLYELWSVTDFPYVIKMEVLSDNEAFVYNLQFKRLGSSYRWIEA
jgi:hypothetical protein